MRNNYFLDLDKGEVSYDCKEFVMEFPPQSQDTQPGLEYLMVPRPIFDDKNYKAIMMKIKMH